MTFPFVPLLDLPLPYYFPLLLSLAHPDDSCICPIFLLVRRAEGSKWEVFVVVTTTIILFPLTIASSFCNICSMLADAVEVAGEMEDTAQETVVTVAREASIEGIALDLGEAPRSSRDDLRPTKCSR